MQDLIDRLFAATNAFDFDGVLQLFAADAAPEDTSVGERFRAEAGVHR